jgi:hypothetical protein
MKINVKNLNNLIDTLNQKNKDQLTNFYFEQDNKSFSWNKPLHNPDIKKQVFSITKMISGLAIGIALDSNLLSLNDSVSDILKIKTINKDIQVRDILTMSPGISIDEYSAIMHTQNWVESFFNQNFDCKSGNHYIYSSHCAHILSALISAVTKQDIKDYLDKKLFTPLNIVNIAWEKSPEGLSCGGMGLSLSIDDLKKIAQLIMNDGRHNGHQLISKNYLTVATSPLIKKPSNTLKPLSDQYFGYQFHVSSDDVFRADGAFGQMLYFDKKNNFFLIIQSAGLKAENILQHIQVLTNSKKIESLETPEQLRPSLHQKNSSTFALPSFTRNTTFKLQSNALGLTKIQYYQSSDCVQVVIKSSYSDFLTFKFSPKAVKLASTNFTKDISCGKQRYFSQMTHCSNHSLELKIEFLESPYVITFKHSFNQSKSTFKITQNVGFNPLNIVLTSPNTNNATTY